MNTEKTETEKWLRKNHIIIRNKVMNIPGFLALLSSNDPLLISPNEKEKIKNDYTCPTSSDKWDQISDVLIRRSIHLPLSKLQQFFIISENGHLIQEINKENNLDENFESFWNVGPRNDHYTGHTEILKNLENPLESKSWKNSTLKFVLYGMGGVGKTSIVTEFLYRNRTKFSNIFWFGAEVNLAHQICQLAKNLNFRNSDNIDPKDKIEFAQNFIKSWLDTKVGWVIVYDNVEDFDDIQHFIPRLGGILVATSRNTTYWRGFKEIPVNNFDEIESCHLIQKILKIENEDSQFEKFSAELGYLPLAISVACYCIRLDSTTIKDYLIYLKMAEEKFLKICPNFEEKSVWKSVKISLDKITENCPLAFEFLKIISYFQAEEIPKIFLEEFSEIMRIDKMDMIEIQKFLVKYDLVKLEIQGDHQLYSIHRLVQKSIKSSIDDEYQMLYLVYKIIKRVSGKYTALDTKYILQHVIHLLLYLIEFVQQRKSIKDVRKLFALNEIIIDLIINNNFYQWLPEIKDIDKIFSKYFATIEKIIGDSNEIYWLYFASAKCYSAKNDFENAIQFYDKQLVLSRKIFGESTLTSTAYNNTGFCYSKLGQFSKALEFYEKSLKIELKLGGEKSRKLILKYNNLGSVCISLKEYQKGQEYLDKGLQLVAIHQMKNSNQESLIFENLAKISFDLSDLEKSRKYFNKRINIFIKLYGENSLQVFKEMKRIGDKCVSSPKFALEFYLKLSDLESKFHNQPSQDILDKINICNQKILEEDSFFNKLKKMMTFKSVFLSGVFGVILWGILISFLTSYGVFGS